MATTLRNACQRAASKAVEIIHLLLLHPGAQAVPAAIAPHVINNKKSSFFDDKGSRSPGCKDSSDISV